MVEYYLFSFSLFSITIVTAQITTTSPYSRFGLGDINYGYYQNLILWGCRGYLQ